MNWWTKQKVLKVIMYVLLAFAFINCFLLEICPTLYPEWLRDGIGITSLFVIAFWFILGIVYLIKKNKNKKKKTNVPTIPPFPEIVEMMFDKSLSFSEDMQVIKVIYNEEKTKRFIVLKSVNGYYKYTYEELCVFDEEEWMYICNQENALPAWWSPKDRSFAYSFFGTEEDALSMLMQEGEYKYYFDKM